MQKHEKLDMFKRAGSWWLKMKNRGVNHKERRFEHQQRVSGANLSLENWDLMKL